MRYLLDTNIVSETMRLKPSRRLLSRLARHEGQSAISTVTWLELAYGIRRLPEGARKRALEARLLDIRATLPAMIPFTAEAADWLAGEKARLEAKGKLITCEDGLIAATAWASNLVLISRNTKNFAVYRDLEVADWTR